VLKPYRWQYIVSGSAEPRFQKLLASLVSDTQMQGIPGALGPLMYVPADAKRRRARRTDAAPDPVPIRSSGTRPARPCLHRSA
jgi:hypothetical protein